MTATINAVFGSHVDDGKDEASLSSNSSLGRNCERESCSVPTTNMLFFGHPPDLIGTETVENIKEALEDLDEEIENHIDDLLKMAYLKALKKCPEIVKSAEHRLLFLRCEHYHIELAALRLVRYWGKRLELFGEDRAFKPIGGPSDWASLREDAGALALGLLQVLPGVYDAKGRGILLESPQALYRSAQTKRVKRTGILRSLWYVLHVALMEDLQLQERGIVLLVNGSTASIAQLDFRLIRMMMESLRGCIPIRVAAFHVCRPPLWIGLFLPFFQSLMTPILRARLWVHISTRLCSEGRRESVVRAMSRHGIPPSSIPAVLGGTAQVDLEGWLSRQQKAAREYRESHKLKVNEESSDERSSVSGALAESMTSTTTSMTASSAT